MAFSDIKSSRKAKIVTAAVVVVVAIAVIALSAVSCSNESSAGAIGADKAIARAVESANDNIEEANHEEAAPEDAVASNEDAEEMQSGDDGASASETPQAEESEEPGTRESAKPSGNAGNASPSSPQSASEAPKKWVEDTEQVWVEDRAAWTEQVPVYSTKEVSICNVCGADITGIATTHGKAHMLAGEGSGHHRVPSRILRTFPTAS